MKRKRIAQATALAATLLSATANATLIGDTITATGLSLTPATATVGAGPEFVFFDGAIAFDFDASTLTISNPVPGRANWGDFGDYVFGGFDEIITGLSIASNTGFSGAPLSNFSFTANSITVSWGDGSATGQAQLVFDIQTQAAAQVPEPDTLFLAGLGVSALAIWRRRRQRPAG